MGESFIPAEFWDINPKFLNFLKNPVTVQFDHRILGMTTGVLIFLIWIYSRIKNIDNNLKYKINILLLFIIFQISLGIATLQSYVAIPIALFHQSGALIIFTISIWILKSLPLVTK